MSGFDEADTCNLFAGEDVPIPTELPVNTNTFDPYVPATIVLSLNTSKTGIPEIVFTLNNEPLKLSVTSNSVPLEPSALNTLKLLPLPYTFNLLIGVVVPIPTLPVAVTNIDGVLNVVPFVAVEGVISNASLIFC